MTDHTLREALQDPRFHDRIAQAIGDPGSFLPRGDNYQESIPRWSLRAVLHVLAEIPAEPAGLVIKAHDRSSRLLLNWDQLSMQRRDGYINGARAALEAALPFLQPTNPDAQWSEIETEYAVDYDGGHTHISTDRADAEEFVQWMVNGRLVSRTVARTEWTEVDR